MVAGNPVLRPLPLGAADQQAAGGPAGDVPLAGNNLLAGDRPLAGNCALAGSKAAHLAELLQLGAPVPPGLVLDTSWMQAMLEVTGQRPLIEHWLAARDPAPLPPTAEQALLTAPITGSLQAALTALERELPHRLPAANGYAVRSSACGEDGSTYSAAGLFSTELRVPAGDVVAAIRRCWRSAFTLPVRHYWQRRGLPPTLADLKLAVLLQPSLPARWAGVALSVDPVNGDASQLLIEYCSGVGEALAQGELCPGRLRLDKFTGACRRHQIASDIPPLPMPHARTLADWLRRLERHYGAYQDLEWAVVEEHGEERLYLLQCRPESHWNSRRHEARLQPRTLELRLR